MDMSAGQWSRPGWTGNVRSLGPCRSPDAVAFLWLTRPVHASQVRQLTFCAFAAPPYSCIIIVCHTHLSHSPPLRSLCIVITLAVGHGTHQADVFVAANHCAKPFPELSDRRTRPEKRLRNKLFSSINLLPALCTGGGFGLNVLT
jgi:hypothetical protein